jgi:CheY-like chemotaxis protein
VNQRDERPPTILVVEDDPWIRALLVDLLPGEGYTVVDAVDGAAALRLVREHHPAAVLLDLAMPVMSGLDVLRELRHDEATMSLPVIVISAFPALLESDESLRPDGVIPKPFDVTALLDQVERVTGLAVRP